MRLDHMTGCQMGVAAAMVRQQIPPMKPMSNGHVETMTWHSYGMAPTCHNWNHYFDTLLSFSSDCYSPEDGVSIDFIYRYLIFKWIAVTWKNLLVHHFQISYSKSTRIIWYQHCSPRNGHQVTVIRLVWCSSSWLAISHPWSYTIYIHSPNKRLRQGWIIQKSYVLGTVPPWVTAEFLWMEIYGRTNMTEVTASYMNRPCCPGAHFTNMVEL